MIGVVGAGGTLGAMLVRRLSATPFEFRADEGAPSAIAACDVVVNVGGPRVRPGLRSDDYAREHLGVAAHVLGRMRRGAHLVHVSSTAVYGARGARLAAQAPEQPARFPTAGYAFAKLAAESYVRAEHARAGVAVSVLRPSMVYGPGIDSALSTIRRVSRHGVRVIIRPRSLRQHLVHVDLLVAAIERAIAEPLGSEPCIVADPFVLESDDITPREGAPVAIDVARIQRVQQEFARRIPWSGGRALEALAVLALDNVFDWESGFERLGLATERFERARSFDPYWRGAP
ncbi:MAG TPA: SDR family oxidoreductase [Polyangiaceae bacterium]|nr:SDR family oxidoreductase [Polyangiaceae bacterium]